LLQSPPLPQSWPIHTVTTVHRADSHQVPAESSRARTKPMASWTNFLSPHHQLEHDITRHRTVPALLLSPRNTSSSAVHHHRHGLSTQSRQCNARPMTSIIITRSFMST
jgi:hypothetical protein